MDSVIAQRNDGFDKDGNFLNGQTQLLPWLNDIKFGFSTDVNLSPYRIVPNPADPTGGYFISAYTTFTYYNSDGTVRWVADSNDISTTYHRFGGLGVIREESNGVFYYCQTNAYTTTAERGIVKINLETGTVEAAPNTYNNINNIGLNNDNTIYFNLSDGSCFLLDPDTLAATTDSNKLGMFTTTDGVVKTGAVLFGGGLVLIESNYSRFVESRSSNSTQFDMASVLFAINHDVDMSASKSNKVALRTEHCLALNMFIGTMRQISKDLFICRGVAPKSEWSHTGYATRYYSRTELERWASDCIYATTGFRIPLTESA